MSAPDPALCPSCQSPASGKFCSNCGAPLAGARCASCHAPLTPGAKFCHRCGTEAGAAGQGAPRSEGSANIALPWAVAGIALLALVALVAGQRFGRPSANAADATPQGVVAGPDGATASAPGAAAAVDISRLTPEQRAARLFDRIMALAERGRSDSVQFFAPMAIQAYAMIGDLTPDQHYDVGRIAIVSGDEPAARAQADSILREQPSHLLGLLLATDAALLRNDVTAERAYTRRFVAAAPAERAKQLPEYGQHANDIERRLEAARSR